MRGRRSTILRLDIRWGIAADRSRVPIGVAHHVQALSEIRSDEFDNAHRASSSAAC